MANIVKKIGIGASGSYEERNIQIDSNHVEFTPTDTDNGEVAVEGSVTAKIEEMENQIDVLSSAITPPATGENLGSVKILNESHLKFIDEVNKPGAIDINLVPLAFKVDSGNQVSYDGTTAINNLDFASHSALTSHISIAGSNQLGHVKLSNTYSLTGQNTNDFENTALSVAGASQMFNTLNSTASAVNVYPNNDRSSSHPVGTLYYTAV